MKGFFVLIVTSVIMGWLTARARGARARRNSNGWLYRPIGFLRAVFTTGFAMGLAFVLFGWRGPQSDRVMVMTVGFLFVAFVTLSWPKAVLVSSVDLRQRSWYLGWKVIPWDEVLSTEERRDQCIVVRSDHCKLVFSPYHVDRQHFVQQLQDHGQLKSFNPRSQAKSGRMKRIKSAL